MGYTENATDRARLEAVSCHHPDTVGRLGLDLCSPHQYGWQAAEIWLALIVCKLASGRSRRHPAINDIVLQKTDVPSRPTKGSTGLFCSDGISFYSGSLDAIVVHTFTASHSKCSSDRTCRLTYVKQKTTRESCHLLFCQSPSKHSAQLRNSAGVDFILRLAIAFRPSLDSHVSYLSLSMAYPPTVSCSIMQ